MIGRRLLHYEIVEKLGEGGMGVVYKARDTHLDRFVAIKVLPPERVADATRKARFVQEAKAASALNHPNIVTIHDISADAGTDFIAMEHVDGKTLDQLIPRKGMRLNEALKVAIQIADALARAHAAGIIHRDLKPANIMVHGHGHVKVLDFGLAKLTERGIADNDSTMSLAVETREGVIIGTAAYMSPEQAEGRPVDARSDIFSFGAVLHEMLSGQRAFQGDSTMATLSAVLSKEPPPLADDVTPELRKLIAGCLRKDPCARWQHIGDVKILLEQALNGLESAPQLSPPPSGRQNRKGAGAWLAGGVLAGVVTAAGTGWLTRDRWIQPRAEPVLRMLTADSGLSSYPAISRDGSLLVFASDRGGEGGLDLWMQQLGGGSPVQVTKDPEDETDPDISPDGTKIAFRSECKGGGIYVAPALGGEPMLLVPGGRNPRFSPDGQWIAYWAGRETSSYQPGSAGVFLIRAGGGETRQIHSEFAAALYPVWSPRGDSLLVLGRREAKEQLPDDLDWWVLPLDGRPARKSGALPILLADKLGHLIGQYALVPLAWSDAQFGGKVLFAAQRGDAANIWELPLSVKSGQASGRAARVTSGTGVNNSVALASTATGPRLVYSNLNLNFDIWALPLDEESGQARGALQRVTEGTSLDLFPSLSTDGRTLAYLNRRIGVWTLRAKDLQTSKESILVSSSLELTYPKISGDGSKVSYADLDGNVWQVATQGGNAVRLCSQCGSPSDSSADGSGVILEPLDTPEDVRKLDARSMQVTELVSRSGRLLGARLSKDEEWVAFHRIEEGQPNPQIFIAPTRGESASPRSGWIAVTSGQNMDRDPRWSPQGKMLYFLSDRDGFRCLWAQRLEPATKRPLGEPFAVEHFHRARLSMTRLTNRSDAIGVAVGRGRVVLAVGEMTGNLWLQIGEP